MTLSSFLYRVMYHTSPLFPDKLYIFLQFWHVLGYKPNLDNPKTFNEKLQWLKLYDRKPIYTKMSDKYAAKEFIAEKVGNEYVIPTLGIYDSVKEIDYDILPNEFVVKTTHDSGTVVVCKDKSTLDRNYVRKYIGKRLKRKYYYAEREWPYKNVKPRIIIEQFLESDRDDIWDYKFYCFNGEPKVLYITTNRGLDGGLKEDFFDVDGHHLEVTQKGYFNNQCTPKLPLNFELMKDLARTLSKGIPHLRVDFYEVNNRVYIGELTFSDGGGYSPFFPEKYNDIFGDWIKLPNNRLYNESCG